MDVPEAGEMAVVVDISFERSAFPRGSTGSANYPCGMSYAIPSHNRMQGQRIPFFSPSRADLSL
jgi:hypothetical protein